MAGSYLLGEGLKRLRPARPYARRAEDPLYRPLRIFTQGPGTSKFEAAVAEVRVPYEPLDPGPVGSLFAVEDEDSGGGRVERVDPEDHRILIDNGLAPSTTDRRFAQLMVYAVASLTYDRFRRALGRNPDFGFEAEPGLSARLTLRPRAFEEDNAYYSRDRRAVEFGYFQANQGASGRMQGGQLIYVCLSHDIVVHEVTHALLDGMRSNFLEPSNEDVLALHEGFADLVALFLRFSYREVVRRAIARGDGGLSDGLLTDIAREFRRGREGADRPLRSALFDETIRYDSVHRPHERGEVLMRAVFDAFAAVYGRKTEAVRRLALSGGWREGSPLPAELVDILASAAQHLAEQFLNIVIRAIDYCPPVDVTFGEYLRAMITADFDLVPDDPWGYREALITSFRRLGIPVPDVPDLSEDALLWKPPHQNRGRQQSGLHPAAGARAPPRLRRLPRVRRSRYNRGVREGGLRREETRPAVPSCCGVAHDHPRHRHQAPVRHGAGPGRHLRDRREDHRQLPAGCLGAASDLLLAP